jgi:hypothetical protein
VPGNAPISYAVNGKQYIAIGVGNGSYLSGAGARNSEYEWRRGDLGFSAPQRSGFFRAAG